MTASPTDTDVPPVALKIATAELASTTYRERAFVLAC